MSLESEVLDIIRPTEAERRHIGKTAELLRKKTEEYIRKNNLSIAEVRYVGSYAKDTYLSDPDLDLFLMFPCETPGEQLVKEGLKTGEDVVGGVRMYAEHPYTRGKFGGLDVDVVPSYLLENTKKLQSSVDRTPFHTDYIKKNLKPEQRDEVRLLKKFMKGIETYGAEPDTRGFSGYLCELLVLKYGSFRKALEAASEWRKGTVIEIEGKGPSSVAPLTVYDPVDPRRNVASAVHIDTMSLFIVAAKSYLANPDIRFFMPREREPLSRDVLLAKPSTTAPV